MDAAVSLSLHPHPGAGPPLPATLPPPPLHHHRALPHIRLHSSSAAAAVAPPKAAPAAPSTTAAACLTLPARPLSPARQAPAPSRSSARAATGYAAALADACARAGTLRRAARDARALMSRRRPSPQEKEEVDARVAALVRMLARKGRDGMVAEVLAEFAAICDHLLPRPRLHHLAY